MHTTRLTKSVKHTIQERDRRCFECKGARHLIMSLREASQYLSCEVDDPMYSFRPDRDGPKPVCTECLAGLCQKIVAAEPNLKEQFNDGKALGDGWSAPE